MVLITPTTELIKYSKQLSCQTKISSYKIATNAQI